DSSASSRWPTCPNAVSSPQRTTDYALLIQGGQRPKMNAWSSALRSVILSAVPAKNQSEPALPVSVSLEASLKTVWLSSLSSRKDTPLSRFSGLLPASVRLVVCAG